MATATTSASTEQKSAPPLWQYVAVDDFSLPGEPVLQSAKSFFDHLYDLILLRRGKDREPVKAADELGLIAAQRLQELVPEPDWRVPAALLEEAVEQLPESGSNAVLLVGPPFSGRRSILDALISKDGCRAIEPPTDAQIFGDDDAWLEQVQKSDATLLLPALERMYFRHVSSLGLVRRLMERIASGCAGRAVIGCDSWAWAFLEPLWRGRKPAVITLQAFDDDRLNRSFLERARASGGGASFRETDSGRNVLSDNERDDSGADNGHFLQILASRSRGNIGVATELWKSALQVEPEKDEHEKNGKQDDAAEGSIWVKPLDKLSIPFVSSAVGVNESLVLHALLLHDGLRAARLAQLLPRTDSPLDTTLSMLEESRLVAEHDGIWMVSPAGYPAVRQFLKSGGYLVDAF